MGVRNHDFGSGSGVSGGFVKPRLPTFDQPLFATPLV